MIFDGDKKSNLLSSPSFAMCPDGFLAFLRIARSSQDVRLFGDTAVGKPSIFAAGDSSVGTPSFSANLWSKIGLAINVFGDSSVSTTSVSAVGDSAVSSPSFYKNLWSKVDLLGNVLLLSLSAKFPFAASKYDFDFLNSQLRALCRNLLVRHPLVVENFCYLSPVECRILHRFPARICSIGLQNLNLCT